MKMQDLKTLRRGTKLITEKEFCDILEKHQKYEHNKEYRNRIYMMFQYYTLHYLTNHENDPHVEELLELAMNKGA